MGDNDATDYTHHLPSTVPITEDSNLENYSNTWIQVLPRIHSLDWFGELLENYNETHREPETTLDPYAVTTCGGCNAELHSKRDWYSVTKVRNGYIIHCCSVKCMRKVGR